MSRRPTPPATEATEAGDQHVMPGVRPLTEADRIAARAAQPMAPRRSPDAPQKQCDHGLFDAGARAQTDLIDLIRNRQPDPKET